MKPTVGRIVHFMDGGQPLPAIITKVHNDTCVNLRVFYDTNRNGAWKSSVMQGTGDSSWAWPACHWIRDENRQRRHRSKRQNHRT